MNGGAGNDLFNGGSANDRLAGGAGNDPYLVSDAGVLIEEGLDAGDGAVHVFCRRM